MSDPQEPKYWVERDVPFGHLSIDGKESVCGIREGWHQEELIRRDAETAVLCCDCKFCLHRAYSYLLDDYRRRLAFIGMQQARIEGLERRVARNGQKAKKGSPRRSAR